MLLPQIRLFSYQKLHLLISAIFSLPKGFSCAILKIFLVMLTYGAASYSSADFLLRVSAALTYGGWGCGFCLLRRGKNYAMIQKMQERMDNYG